MIKISKYEGFSIIGQTVGCGAFGGNHIWERAKNILCPSQYLQEGNVAAIFYSFLVKSVFLLITSLLLSSIFDFAFYENIAARVTFGCHTYINFQRSLCELEMKYDMTLGRQEKKVMRHLVVPASHKQPPPHLVPPFSR